MHVFEFVLLILIIGTFGSALNRWLKNKNTEKVFDTSKSDERIDALEKRVQVLERIATDKSEQLKEEINNLKD